MKLTQEVRQGSQQRLDYIQSLWIHDVCDTDLMLTAFVHKSYANDYTTPYDHNERLEFVGDGVLGAVTNKLLFHDFLHEAESQLTLYKIALVREETLAHVARDIRLGAQLRIGNGEERSGWRNKDSVLSDSLEALLWYLYLDQGEEAVHRFVESYIYPKLEELKARKGKSYKSLIQERCQQKFHILPEYDTTEDSYDEYGTVTVYHSRVMIDHQETKREASWKGKNKKKSQEEAAKMLWEYLQQQEREQEKK